MRRNNLAIVVLLALGGCSAGGALGAGDTSPKEMLASCVRLLTPGDRVQDPSDGLVRFEDFIKSLAAKPDAQLRWEKYGERSYILHDIVQDRVAGGAQAVDMRFYPRPDPGPQGPDCGPGQVVVTRLVFNGTEAEGFEIPRTVDAMLAKVPRGR